MFASLNRLKSDDSLMQAYQRGDADAFECLYHRHKDGLFAFLYQGCASTAVAEDIAQEAWTAVIRGAASYQPRGHFKTWLYQIGRNRLTDFWRRRDNNHEALEAEPATPNTTSEPGASELEKHLLQAVAELPGEQRDVVLLREQGFSLSDIANITGSGAETVKSRLRYARKQLRAQLGDSL